MKNIPFHVKKSKTKTKQQNLRLNAFTTRPSPKPTTSQKGLLDDDYLKPPNEKKMFTLSRPKRATPASTPDKEAQTRSKISARKNSIKGMKAKKT